MGGIRGDHARRPPRPAPRSSTRPTARLAATDDATLVTRLDDPYLVAAALLLVERPVEALRPLDRGDGAGARRTAGPRRADAREPALDDATGSTSSSSTPRSRTRRPRRRRRGCWATRPAAPGADGALRDPLAPRRAQRGAPASPPRRSSWPAASSPRPRPRRRSATPPRNAVDEDPERCIRRHGGRRRPDARARRPVVEHVAARRAGARRASRSGGSTRRRPGARGSRRARVATETPRRPRAAGTARAELLLAHGDAAGAARLATETADRAAGEQIRLDSIVARLLAGRALAAAGERDAAVDVLQRVAAEAGARSAALYVDAASRELRRLGSRLSAAGRRGGREPARRARSPSGSRDIAALVAQGAHEQGGGRGAVPVGEDDRAPPLARLREAGRALAVELAARLRR